MITVGKLTAADRDAWEALFRAYCAFYEEEHPQSMYDRAWTEFQADTRMHALGARVDAAPGANGPLTGITHFLVHPRTTAPDTCYLEDLFTAPEYRGHGVARALIEAVAQWAGERGCSRVYWHTRQSNTTARLLYDKVAVNSGFIMYTRELRTPRALRQKPVAGVLGDQQVQPGVKHLKLVRRPPAEHGLFQVLEAWSSARGAALGGRRRAELEHLAR